tara:strand:+ start:558 stop:896 length:339 start_codon:yes stop_codon:yes gene_type:complete
MSEAIDEDAVRARLLALQAEYDRRGESGRDARTAVELDQTKVGRLSRMDALQGQAMAQETARRGALELKRIAAALHRLEIGEYGYCIRCGDAISAGRLQSDPATPTCIKCAA